VRAGRSWEPRQTFYAGLRKQRELTHDSKVYRAYLRAEERLRDQGGRMDRVVLDYELKRDYQRFLHERNRGRKDCDGRPDREPEEIARWARERDLPYEDGMSTSLMPESSTKIVTGVHATKTSRS
jgi:hypothetical protein